MSLLDYYLNNTCALMEKLSLIHISEPTRH